MRSRPAPGDSRVQATVLVTIWAVSAAAYLVYATLFGTIEEQMYYILLLPSAISLCLWFADEPWAAIPALAEDRRRPASLWLCSSTPWHGSMSTRARTTSTVRCWPGRRSTSLRPRWCPPPTGLSQFLLPRGDIGQWSTVPELKAHHVDYVVVNLSLVDQGYGLADPSFERVLQRQGRLVFEANGPTDVSLRIYDVQSITGSSR